jgi:rod shape-determining protein MreC
VSSGLGGVYPPGYPVARVTAVVRDPGQPLLAVEAEPLAGLDRVPEVLLVWFENVIVEPEPDAEAEATAQAQPATPAPAQPQPQPQAQAPTPEPAQVPAQVPAHVPAQAPAQAPPPGETP